MAGKRLEMPGKLYSLRLSSSAAFFMSLLKFVIELKESIKTFLIKPHPNFGTAITLKIKLHSLSGSEDLSSGAKKITCHRLLQSPLKSYGKIFPNIKLRMIIPTHTAPVIW
jgi:hypothetical protein